MDQENLVGLVIMVVCCWGCAALFLGIGIYARKRQTPMHFWAGSTVDPSKVTDISAYNRENGQLWMVYSVPYWLAGAVDLWFGGAKLGALVATAILILACIPGIPLLVSRYIRIEKKYIRNPK